MYLCWTVLLIVTMQVTHTAAAVANLPIAPSSSETQLETHVHPPDSPRIFSSDWPDNPQVGCKELRAKRFISDGFCTSLKPIKEVVCAGQCVPIKEQNLPWWSEFVKYWAEHKFKEWRCVENVTKLKKVQLMCENGESRHYKIKIVKSCKCKSYERTHNETPDIKTRRGKRQNKEKDKRKKTKRDRKEKNRLRKQRERELRKKERRARRKKDRDSRNVNNSHNADYTSDTNRRHPVATNDSPEL